MRQKLFIKKDLIIELPRGPIGISFSGGVESSLLTYLVLDQLKTFPVHLFTLSMLTRNYIQHIRTGKVLAKICELTNNTNVYQHIDCGNYDDNTTANLMFDEPKKFALEYNIVNSILAGGNANPPDEVVKKSKFFIDGKAPLDKERNPSVVRSVKCNPYLYAPFANLNKQDVIQLYKDHGIHESLLPITQSCWTDPPCNDCWHCFDRNWGMQVLD